MTKLLCLDIGAADGDLDFFGLNLDVLEIDPNLPEGNAVVGDRSGEVKFYRYEDGCYDSLRTINEENFAKYGLGVPVNEASVSTLNCVTVDQLMEKYGRSIDVLKIDAQGCTYEILQGAKNALRNTSFVLCEVEWVELYNGQVLAEENIKFLREHGFEIVHYNHNHFTDLHILTWSDLLFVNVENLKKLETSYGKELLEIWNWNQTSNFKTKLFSKILPRKTLRKLISFFQRVISERSKKDRKHRDYGTGLQ